jgi:hypothetical protein
MNDYNTSQVVWKSALDLTSSSFSPCIQFREAVSSPARIDDARQAEDFCLHLFSALTLNRGGYKLGLTQTKHETVFPIHLLIRTDTIECQRVVETRSWSISATLR